MLKKCVICEKEFEGKGNKQTCSKKCKKKLYDQTKERLQKLRNERERTGKPVGRPRKEPVVQTKQPNESSTLCWSCQNACGGCSWSKRLKPVRGWKADKIKIKLYMIGGEDFYSDSYFVRECPKYIMDEIRGK